MIGTVLRVRCAYSDAVDSLAASLGDVGGTIVRYPSGDGFNLTLSDATSLREQVEQATSILTRYRSAFSAFHLRGARCELDVGIERSDDYPFQTLRIPTATLGLLSKLGIDLAVTRYA